MSGQVIGDTYLSKVIFIPQLVLSYTKQLSTIERDWRIVKVK